MTRGARLTRRGRLAVTLTVISIVIAGGTYAVTRTSAGTALGLRQPSPPCRIDVGDTTVSWTTDQAMTATTVAAVGRRIGASDDGIATAVSRTLRGSQNRSVDAAAARVIYGSLPARATPTRTSRDLAAALLGRHGGALTCTPQAVPGNVPDQLPVEQLGPLGLTPRADAVRLAMRETFGKQNLGGFAPGGVHTGHFEGSAHYEGRAIDVFFRPISAATQELGWQQAQWAVAHADQLALATVIFDRRIWSAEHATSGWRDYNYPGGATDNPILLHEDHVHVDVVRGTG